MEEKKYTLVNHLQELRYRLIVCVVFFVFASLLSYSLIDKALPFLIAPVGKLVFIAPTETFMAYIHIALFLGFFVSLPILLYQAWRFISSGLKQSEIKYVLFFGPFSLVFFLCGVIFAYLVVLPLGIRFLLTFSAENLKPMISIKNYLSFVTTMLIVFGFVFELPIVAMFLTKLNLISPSFLISKWRHAFVSVFIVAAILTPPDIVTQVLMVLPLIVLYLISIFFSRLVYKKSTYP